MARVGNGQLAEVDATLVAVRSSTKNSHGERDPEMHQAKKGNQWHFGMKAHIREGVARLKQAL